MRPVAISVDKPEESRDLIRKAGYSFPFLSDPNAEVMGLTVKAVKSLLCRARMNLREALKDYILMDEQHVPDASEEDE